MHKVFYSVNGSFMLTLTRDGPKESVKWALIWGASRDWPHIFIFDQDRKLAYEGRIDDSTVIANMKVSDARNAIDAMLAGQPVPVASTRTFGCSTKWLSSHSTGVAKEKERIAAEPVSLTPASTDDLKAVKSGKADIMDVRRHVLATIPNDGWFGVQEYWASVIKEAGTGQ